MELDFEQQGKPNDYCLNTPFHPQKVHSKTFSTPISTNISCKINHLPGSDPAIMTITWNTIEQTLKPKP